MKLTTLITIKELLEKEVFNTANAIHNHSKDEVERVMAAQENARLSAALEDLKNHDFH